MTLKSLLPLSDRERNTTSALSPFVSLQREIDRVFDTFVRTWPSFGGIEVSPRLDVTERDGHVDITVELPGLADKDVTLEFAENVLTISGEKKSETEEKTDRHHVVERSFGSFSRAIELPAGVNPDEIKARMARGVLTVTFPSPAATKPEARRISVRTA